MRLEAVVGAGVVLLVVVLLGSVRLFIDNPLSDNSIYMARFSNVGNLNVGTDVKISGIKVGIVKSLKVDENYQALAVLELNKSVELPSDTTAAISTDGLIGNKFVSLEIGSDDDILAPNSEITSTKSALNLEDLIDKFIIGAVSGGK